MENCNNGIVGAVEKCLDNGHYDDPKDVVNIVKHLLNTLKFNNEQKDEIVKLTTKRLQTLFDERKIIKRGPIKGFGLYKDESGKKEVHFRIINKEVVAVVTTNLGSPNLKKILEVDDYMNKIKYRGGKEVDPTANIPLIN